MSSQNHTSSTVVEGSRGPISSKFGCLPEEIVRHILSYGPEIKYRAGKYMNQLLPNDPRRGLLLTMPVPRCTECLRGGLTIEIVFPRKVLSLTIFTHVDKPTSYCFESLVQCHDDNNTYIRY